jgi:hypothetical protein
MVEVLNGNYRLDILHAKLRAAVTRPPMPCGMLAKKINDETEACNRIDSCLVFACGPSGIHTNCLCYPVGGKVSPRGLSAPAQE